MINKWKIVINDESGVNMDFKPETNKLSTNKRFQVFGKACDQRWNISLILNWVIKFLFSFTFGHKITFFGII